MMPSSLVSRWLLLAVCVLSAAMISSIRMEAASGPRVAPLTLTAGGLEVGTDVPAFEAKVRELKRMGFTSVQTYVYWNKVEPSPGEINWSEYDREVEVYTRAGLKWVPFIIMGPWYVTPQWVREKQGMVMYRCLEHGREMAIPSLWSAGMRDHVRHSLRQLAAHYGPKGVLESVNIGITGDYGEAIYPVIGNWPGEYHSHAGYWCGDALAEADFRAHVQTLYPEGIDALNRAWRSDYGSWAEVRPFLPAKAPSERAWQEFLAWYRDEMTEFSDFCLAETRAAFPGVDVYLCTGGDMAPEHGSDFSAQAKVAAKHGAGVRITNEGSSFGYNVRLTRLVATAGHHYGAYFGNEPASYVSAEGMVGRMFNAVTSGANQMFAWSGELMIDPKTGKWAPMGEQTGRLSPLFREQQRPRIDAVVYQPNLSASQVLSAEVAQSGMARVGEFLAEFRRFIDYDLADDRLIQDGVLAGKRILFVANAQVVDARTTRAIADWVRSGGLLFVLGYRPIDWDGSTAPFDDLTGFTPETDDIRGIDTKGMRIARPDLLPSIAALTNVTPFGAYRPLAPDVEILMGMQYSPDLAVAWRKPLGKGMVYSYFGSMDLRQNEASWAQSHRLPLRFIQDLLQSAITEKRLAAVPTTLNFDLPDVYKVETDAGLWILNMGAEARDVPVGVGRTVRVSSFDIALHPRG
jgi:hypothetical protein